MEYNRKEASESGHQVVTLKDCPGKDPSAKVIDIFRPPKPAIALDKKTGLLLKKEKKDPAIGEPGNTQAVSVVAGDTSDIGFIRAHGIMLGKCNACRKRMLGEKEMALLIEFHNGDITLCALHESMLLERLIINHVKRTRKRGAKGLKPDYLVDMREPLTEVL